MSARFSGLSPFGARYTLALDVPASSHWWLMLISLALSIH